MEAITITQTDIELVFGAVFVAQWASFTQGQNPVANAARIAQACSIGKNWFNGRVANGPYATPLSADVPPAEIVDAMATYAGYWLFTTRGLNYAKDTLDWMKGHYTRINDLVASIRRGNYPIDCAFNTGRRQTPMVV